MDKEFDIKDVDTFDVPEQWKDFLRSAFNWQSNDKIQEDAALKLFRQEMRQKSLTIAQGLDGSALSPEFLLKNAEQIYLWLILDLDDMDKAFMYTKASMPPPETN